MLHLCDTITLRAYFDSCHSIYVTEDFLYIFIKQPKPWKRDFTWAVVIICISRIGWTPIEIALVFRVSPAPFSSRASYLPSFTSPLFFVNARCLYRNPFSLLVRVIRGFKTAFHHPTLEKSWRGCHRRERRRWKWRKWRKHGENFSRQELPIE